MIERILIKNEASFGPDPEELKDLKKHNFIFGVNATGKTTISRIIADETAYPDCSVNWSGGNKLETLVYNRDYVKQTFEQTPELKGIFTLGDEDKNTTKLIADAKSEVDKLADEIRGINKTLKGDDGTGGKESELKDLETEFTEKCWTLKLKFDDKFQGAFTGTRNNKIAFMNRLLTEAKENSAQLKSLAELENKAETVFAELPETEAEISEPKFDDLLNLESNSILSKKVIGKTDVDIAAMIKKLGNSDWVKQGRAYFEVNDGICPFCQKVTEESFASSLNEYFDETFESDIKSIEKLNDNYKSYSQPLVESLNELLVSPSKFLDVDKLRSEIELLESKINNNIQRIQSKRDKPSLSVKLDSHSNVLTEIKGIIGTASTAIKEHNKLLINLANEKEKLSSQVWKYLLENEIKIDLASFKKKKEALLKAITSINQQISTKNNARDDEETKIRNLEKSTTSIEPTIKDINEILSEFGFTAFKLENSEKKRYYKLVRPNGEDAKETLSEGERNFLTFLYFFHHLKGSETESGMTTDRVVVFDDPVSSLDSDVCFIVSTLIKQLFEEVRSDSGYIKQIFILTHNVYFHKEVSFNFRRSEDRALNDETYWIVRKQNDVSKLERHEDNPIKTAYELLWREVRNCDGANISIHNTLRRIIEHYFKILGNQKEIDIYDKFTGKEKYICKTLFSWMNAGSHHAFDDIYVSDANADAQSYLNVFRRVFEVTGHPEHYKMMMGDDYQEETP